MPTTITTTARLMPYKSWMTNTNVTLRPRSALLRQLDEAILTYERSGHPKALIAIQQRLKAWQESKGPNDAWKKDSRNKNLTINLLQSQAYGGGDTDAALGTPEFMSPGMINARLGVIYLFSKTEVDDTIFKILLNGAIDVTNAGLNVGNQAAGYAANVLGAAQKPAGTLADKAQNKVAHWVSGKSLIDGNSPPPTESRARQLWEKVRTMIYDAAVKAWQSIKKKIAEFRDDPAGTALDVIPGMLRKLCDFLTGQLIASLAPLIGGALDLTKGIANTIDASMTKYNEWIAGRNVNLQEGYPSTVVQSIRRSMTFSIGEGLYDTLKGAAKVGMDAGTAAGSTILGLVTDVLEAVIKTIWKVIECKRMNSFCGLAAKLWDAREERNALHLQPIAFNTWFKGYAMNIPALSVLSLNSGICGDKMRFLNMFKNDSDILSESEFKAGCGYVDSLKVWGSSYLKDCDFSFSSKDGVVAGLLTLAQSHTEEASTGMKFWQALLGFLNG